MEPQYFDSFRIPDPSLQLLQGSIGILTPGRRPARITLHPIGHSQQPSILRSHAHKLPFFDVEAIFLVQDTEHVPLAGIVLPQLLDARDQRHILVSWVLLTGKLPALELCLKGTFADEAMIASAVPSGSDTTGSKTNGDKAATGSGLLHVWCF